MIFYQESISQNCDIYISALSFQVFNWQWLDPLLLLNLLWLLATTCGKYHKIWLNQILQHILRNIEEKFTPTIFINYENANKKNPVKTRTNKLNVANDTYTVPFTIQKLHYCCELWHISLCMWGELGRIDNERSLGSYLLLNINNWFVCVTAGPFNNFGTDSFKASSSCQRSTYFIELFPGKNWNLEFVLPWPLDWMIGKLDPSCEARPYF